MTRYLKLATLTLITICCPWLLGSAISASELSYQNKLNYGNGTALSPAGTSNVSASFPTLYEAKLICSNWPNKSDTKSGIGNKRIKNMSKKVNKTNAEWKTQLTTEQYRITREKGTEPAFTGRYYNCKKQGTYKCACCGNELFSSDTKYDSGTGWPSFWAPVNKEHVDTEEDHSLGMKRMEVTCKKCGAHLGHVFEDGPKPTNLRYCINSASLELDERKSNDKP